MHYVFFKQYLKQTIEVAQLQQNWRGSAVERRSGSFKVTDYSERELTCTSVCRLSVTFVHPTQAIEIFGNISTPFGTMAICDLSIKILRRSSQENPSVGELNTRGVAKYSDFGSFQGYISETVQDMM